MNPPSATIAGSGNPGKNIFKIHRSYHLFTPFNDGMHRERKLGEGGCEMEKQWKLEKYRSEAKRS